MKNPLMTIGENKFPVIAYITYLPTRGVNHSEKNVYVISNFGRDFCDFLVISL